MAINMIDKILCPWCGAEMFHPIPWQKGTPDMGGYNWTVQAKCRECGALSPKVYGCTKQETESKLYAAAMRRYTPTLKPMTLEEIINTDAEIWFEERNDADTWACRCLFNRAKKIMTVYYIMANPEEFEFDDYGKTWRCWERKPTEEERSAAEWL